MIKRLGFILFIACFSLTAKSQFIHSIEYKAGVSVSAISMKISNGWILFPDDYNGLTTAFNLKYLNHKYWNLSTQLGYTQLGGKDSVQLVTVTGEYLGILKLGYRINYINLTTVLSLKFPVKKFTISVKAGPHIDYLLSAYSYTDNIIRYNYGICIGAGLNYDFNKNLYLSADYTYYWFSDKISSSPEVSITKNANLMLGLGYKF